MIRANERQERMKKMAEARCFALEAEYAAAGRSQIAILDSLARDPTWAGGLAVYAGKRLSDLERQRHACMNAIKEQKARAREAQRLAKAAERIAERLEAAIEDREARLALEEIAEKQSAPST